uniref:Ovule protein n=1 Tax=Ascaris lumbricoides TaxID=6252 RepID=A0A0M3I1L6_ASCLU
MKFESSEVTFTNSTSPELTKMLEEEYAFSGDGCSMDVDVPHSGMRLTFCCCTGYDYCSRSLRKLNQAYVENKAKDGHGSVYDRNNSNRAFNKTEL